MKIRYLTRAELAVMQILWGKGDAYVHEILAEMPEPKPAYNTVSTVIRVLEKKGVVGHHALGKSYKYYALIEKEQYVEWFMEKIMEEFFNDSPAQMAAFLCKKRQKPLSLTEMESAVAVIQGAISRQEHSFSK